MQVRSLEQPQAQEPSARYASRALTNPADVVETRRAAVRAAQQAAVAAEAQAQSLPKPRPPPREKGWTSPSYPPPPKGGKRRTRKSASNKKRKTRRTRK
jgi:hypothetical protein